VYSVFVLLLLLHCFIFILLLSLCCVSRLSLYCIIPSDLCTVFVLLLLLYCFIVILVLLLCCVYRYTLYCNIPSDLSFLCLSCMFNKLNVGNSLECGRFGALKSDSTHHFFRNACTKWGSLRFSQFSGCWLILSVYIIMNFYFPFVRLFGVR
jgi:hypothetical protein